MTFKTSLETGDLIVTIANEFTVKTLNVRTLYRLYSEPKISPDNSLDVDSFFRTDDCPDLRKRNIGRNLGQEGKTQLVNRLTHFVYFDSF